MNQKTAIYIRVSTQMQVDRDSLGVQRRELIAYSEMILGISDYVVFEDAGFSAKNTDRPDYQNMLRRLRTGEFSHLLVWKIDRISRNLLDFAEMYAELKKCGIVFVSKNEQFDTSNAIGEAMLKIILVFAELERKMTAERVTAVMLSRANNGQWNGGRIPYGYIYNGETFERHPVESEIVERIYTEYSSAHSVIYVVKSLNASGIRTRNGNEWSPPSVHKILTNPFYIGDYRYNVHGQDGKKDKSEYIVTHDHHIPLVHPSRFEYVQNTLKNNSKESNLKGKTYTRSNVHIFAGKLYCDTCGSMLSATLDRRRADGWRPSMYACGSRRKRTCNSKYISDVTLAPQIFTYLANMLVLQNSYTPNMTVKQAKALLMSGDALSGLSNVRDDGILSTLESLANIETRAFYEPVTVSIGKSAISAMEDKLRKVRIALDRLKTLYLYSDSGMPEAEYITERAKLEAEAQGIEREIASARQSEYTDESREEFETQASTYIMLDILANFSLERFLKFIRTANYNVPKAFVNACIDRIVVSNGNIKSITFKNGITHIWEQ